MSNLNVCYVADGVCLDSKVADIVHVTEVVEGLRHNGFKISLIIRAPRKNKIKANAQILTIPSLKFPFSFASYFLGLFHLIVVVLNKPALFYVRDTGINMAILLGRACRIPTILEINGDLENEYSGIPQPFYSLVRFLTNLSYRSADCVVVPSLKLMHRINRERSSSQVFHIPNGVNPNQFYPMDKSDCRKELNLGNGVYFCFVGHLASWQGVENSLIAFSRLLACHPNLVAKYLIVGTGPFLPELRALSLKLEISEKVIFFGSVSHDKVPCIIGASDVCVAPFKFYRNEKIGISPLKIYEYLSSGRPVITSQIPGLEIVSQLNAGLLVTPDSIEELASAYKKMLSNLPYFEKKALAASIIIAKKHSWSSRVLEITKIINSICSRKNNRHL
jgi:glycosyltransferase involved in cell wall biosynthesis